ncbi:MAG: YfgM family protein [Burkholderiaceae bacterium]
MAYNFEEQDQIDQIKSFWNKNGTFILTVVTIVALSVAGYRLWGWYQQNEAAKAATAFSVLKTAVKDKDTARINGASQTLLDEYGGSILAPMGALVAAKAHFEAKDLDAAAQALRWIIDNSPDTEFAPIARLRLAGVLLDQKQAEQGLALLNIEQMPDAFHSQAHDRRGDLLAELGRTEEAVAAYQAALESLGGVRGASATIQLKLDSLKGGA